MILQNLKDKNIILASKSPRRQELLRGLEIDFEIRTKEVEEVWPENLQGAEVAVYLAQLKARAFHGELMPNDLLITSDTTVLLAGKILNKPADRTEALHMLSELSGRTHIVVTGVCLTTVAKTHAFYDETKVTFAQLTAEEIAHYVDTYKPYDKAGAYGAQEFMGFIGVEKLEGSYFNVMGLPMQKLYQELKRF